MKETKMWKELKKAFKEVVPYGLIERIESSITPGIPDIHYRTAQHEGWVELKQLKRRRDHWVVPFRPGQFAWLNKYYILNGVSVLVATIDTDWYFFMDDQIKERYYTLRDYVSCPMTIIRTLLAIRPIKV